MKKAMISQPMRFKTDEEIKLEREKAKEIIKEEGYDFLNTFFEEEWTKKESLEKEGVVNVPLKFLAKSIEKMSLCDAIFFCKGWELARGCVIEHAAAEAYGLKIMYEE